MASLKDMRVRIASTKATQKITKAMQMVAASKLRRAQAAAEAARPYAERMEAVLRQYRFFGDGYRFGAEAARRHRAATRCICWWSAPAERGLCGPFNSAIVRLAREKANELIGPRQGGENPLRRAQGLRSASPELRKADCRDSRSSRCAQSRLSKTPRRSPKSIERRFDSGEFDVCTLFFSRFKSVIAQIPTALQIIPPVFPEKQRKRAGGEHPTNTSRTKTTFLANCCRAISPCRCSARCWKTPPPNRARDERDGQRHAQRRRHDPASRPLNYNRTRQAMITKELIEIISGAEAL